MWILQFLPNWIFYYILFGAGIGLLIAKFLPKYYKEIVGTTSAIVFAFGLFMVGAISNEEVWQARVKEMEAKVAQAEAQSANKNTEIQEKVVEKTKVIREKGRDIIKYVDRWNTKEVIKEVEGPERIRREEVIKYIENCPVPKEMINIHNQATELNKAATK